MDYHSQIANKVLEMFPHVPRDVCLSLLNSMGWEPNSEEEAHIQIEACIETIYGWSKEDERGVNNSEMCHHDDKLMSDEKMSSECYAQDGLEQDNGYVMIEKEECCSSSSGGDSLAPLKLYPNLIAEAESDDEDSGVLSHEVVYYNNDYLIRNDVSDVLRELVDLAVASVQRLPSSSSEDLEEVTSSNSDETMAGGDSDELEWDTPGSDAIEIDCVFSREEARQAERLKSAMELHEMFRDVQDFVNFDLAFYSRLLEGHVERTVDDCANLLVTDLKFCRLLFFWPSIAESTVRAVYLACNKSPDDSISTLQEFSDIPDLIASYPNKSARALISLRRLGLSNGEIEFKLNHFKELSALIERFPRIQIGTLEHLISSSEEGTVVNLLVNSPQLRRLFEKLPSVDPAYVLAALQESGDARGLYRCLKKYPQLPELATRLPAAPRDYLISRLRASVSVDDICTELHSCAQLPDLCRLFPDYNPKSLMEQITTHLPNIDFKQELDANSMHTVTEWLLDHRSNIGKQSRYTESQSDSDSASSSDSENDEFDCSFECGICCEERASRLSVQCNGDHVVCSECLKHAVAEAMHGEGQIQVLCIGDGKCGMEYNPAVLRRHLGKRLCQQLTKRQYMLQLRTLSTDVPIMTCPQCATPFEVAADAAVFDCIHCGVNTCLRCNRPFDEEHFGRKCVEVEDEGETSQRRRYEEQMTNILLRPCPQCKTGILKDSGCNHMTCKCGTHFCYICKQQITVANPYEHFCSHFRENPDDPCPTCQRCHLYDSMQEADLDRIRAVRNQASLELSKPGFEKHVG